MFKRMLAILGAFMVLVGIGIIVVEGPASAGTTPAVHASISAKPLITASHDTNKLPKMKYGTATIVTTDTSGEVTPNFTASCGAGLTCIWEGFNGTGRMGTIAFSQNGPGTCWILPTSWKNVISSTRVTFGSGYGVTWFNSTNCSPGNGALVQSHDTDVNMSGSNAFANDNIESFIVQQQ